MSNDKEKAPMPAIKSAEGPSLRSRSKSATKKSSKKSKKTEWITHYAYLNDKKREQLMQLPELPKMPSDVKKKRRKYGEKRRGVDKLDAINPAKDADEKNKSRSNSSSSSSSSENKDQNKENNSDSESSDDENAKAKSSAKTSKRSSITSQSTILKKRASSATSKEHDLKSVDEYKKENSGRNFHFESPEVKSKKERDPSQRPHLKLDSDKLHARKYTDEELEELNKTYRDSRQEVLSRRAKLDMDKMNIDYDLNYDLIHAFNELEVRPVYKNLLRSIRSNL